MNIEENILKFDFAVLDFIRENIRCGFLDKAMPWVTALGNGGLVWISMTLVMLMIPKTQKLGLVLSASLIMCVLITNLTLKPLVARARPFDLTDIEPLIKPPSDYSFPSGHSSSSFAAATVIFLHDKRFGAAALVLAALIAFSRLYLYVHFPTDVIGGAVLGIIVGALCTALL